MLPFRSISKTVSKWVDACTDDDDDEEKEEENENDPAVRVTIQEDKLVDSDSDVVEAEEIELNIM